MHRHWFERIVPQSLPLALLLGGMVWAFLSTTFAYLLGAFEEVVTEDNSSALGTSLFFASIVVASLLAGAWVIRRSEKLVMELDLICDEDTKQGLRERVGGISIRREVWILILSLSAGLIHNLLLLDGLSNLLEVLVSSRIATGGILGTMLAWVVITSVIMSFIGNSQTFAVIGAEHVRVDFLQPENHSLLGRAALMPTLGLIGTQALYPLLWLGGQINLLAVLPGFLIALAALIYLFIRTTLPLHRRLSRKKADELSVINSRINAVRGTSSLADMQTDDLVEMQGLLDHRTYLRTCPEWPFRLTTVVRWSLYLLIPPLTWVGAALIENLVDTVIA